MRVEGRVVPATLPRLLEQRQRVLPVVVVLHAPATVVQPDHRHVEERGIEPGRFGDLGGEVDRPLAERDDLHGRVVRDRLGHDVHRVRVVEDPRVRADLLHLGADVLQHVDRAERHEEAAGPLRLLPDEAVVERDALVEHPGVEPSRPEGREHGVTVDERCAPVGGRGDRDVQAPCSRDLLREGADQLEPVLVEVDEDDLRAVEVGAVRHQRRHRPCRPGRAAAEVDELDPCHQCPFR